MAISKLLIANRGEIALRVMRTARDMGISTVAVYSDADAKAPHVKFADQAVRLGPPPVGDSYLLGDVIIQAALDCGADAIHPGYGFLSENAAFAKACGSAGIIFVGPPTGAIDVMGDKAKSKRAMIKAGVPCVPGYQGTDQSDATLIKESASIGFPLMVKAAAGGGGRGMRLVHDKAQLPNAIKQARSEAENAFGSGELIIERAVQEPRHVEIQVFADIHGNTIHLGERDCSVQRRHQKVIEESPCPVMTPELRAAMGKAAIDAAKAVDYVGAGTVEFLLDQNGDFYFLEMNTRLQVEHPVTEMVTGLDLVAMQLRVAAGKPLSMSQDDVTLTGHAIEVRIYAEDAENDFLPSTGPIHLWHPADTIRVDGGIETGGEVSPFYDSMVAKYIAHAPSREGARTTLIKALSQSALVGPENNRDFLIDALAQPGFADGSATTAFIAQTYGEDGFTHPALTSADLAYGAVTQHLCNHKAALSKSIHVNCELLNWTSNGTLTTIYMYEADGDIYRLAVDGISGNHYRVRIGEEVINVEVIDHDAPHVKLKLNGQAHTAHFYALDDTIYIQSCTRSYRLSNLASGAASDEAAVGGGTVVAPMHGQLLEILVSEGDAVKTGDKLAVLEAMKMQHEITAEIDGTVTQITAKAGTQIGADDLILEIEGAAEDAEAEG